MGGSGNRQYPRGSLSMYLYKEDPPKRFLKRYLGRAKNGLKSIERSVETTILQKYDSLHEVLPATAATLRASLGLAAATSLGVTIGSFLKGYPIPTYLGLLTGFWGIQVFCFYLDR